MSGRDSEEGKKEAGLDLGLSSLLQLGATAGNPDGGPRSAASSSGDHSVVDPSGDGRDVARSSPDAPLSLSDLAERGEFDELLKISEAALAGGINLQARAWWVYAHLARKSMPSAFLAAPFENLLLGNLGRVSDEERAILGRVGQALIERLTEAGEGGLAQVIREKLSGHKIVLPDKGASANLGTQRSGPTPFSSDERSQSSRGWSLFGESKSSESTLQNEGSHRAETQTTRGQPLADHEALSTLAQQSGLSHLVTSATIDSSPTDVYSPSSILKERPAKKGSLRPLFIVAACVLAGGGALFINFQGMLNIFGAAHVEVASEEFISSPSGVELLPPASRLRDTVGSLTAIFYGMDRTPAPGDAAVGQVKPQAAKGESELPPPPSVTTGAPSVTTGAGAPGLISGPVGAPSIEPRQDAQLSHSAPTVASSNKVLEKESVRVDGPIEPESVLARVQGRYQPGNDSRYDPSRDPRSDSRGRDDRGSARDRTPPDLSPRDRSPSQAGRTTEPRLPESKRSPNGPFGDKPQGDLVMGIPEPSKGGQRYQVITRTLVLAEPFYSAPIVGRLLSGDIVEVESKVGDWLKIRSAKGRPGFVLAQDVTSVPYEEYRR